MSRPLLDNPNVLPEDKQKIRELLKKPWNPYIRRHSALTEKSTILKEHTLRQYAGWSPGSNMHLKYLHYFGNESNDSILEAYGIMTKDKHLSVMDFLMIDLAIDLDKGKFANCDFLQVL